MIRELSLEIQKFKVSKGPDPLAPITMRFWTSKYFKVTRWYQDFILWHALRPWYVHLQFLGILIPTQLKLRQETILQDTVLKAPVTRPGLRRQKKLMGEDMRSVSSAVMFLDLFFEHWEDLKHSLYTWKSLDKCGSGCQKCVRFGVRGTFKSKLVPEIVTAKVVYHCSMAEQNAWNPSGEHVNRHPHGKVDGYII